jgi:hypothetical protein
MIIDWSKAPEGATHKHPFGWYKRVEDKWFCTPCGAEDWKPSIHQWTDNEFLAVRPTEQPAWNGEGLPSVGTLCKFRGHNQKEGIVIDNWLNGDPLEVLAHREVAGIMLPVVYNKRHESASCVILDCLRPIKSERDQQIDALLSIFQTLPYFVFSRDMAADLYDEGVRVEK